MDFHTIIVILCLSLAFVAAVCLIWKATICEQLHLLEDSKCRRILTSFISRTNTYYNIVVVVGLKPIGNFALFCTKKGDKRALKARAAKPLWPSSSLSLQEALLQTDNCPFQKLFFIGKSEVKRSLKKKEGESIVDTELVKEWHDLYCDHKRAKECNWLLLLPFVLRSSKGRERNMSQVSHISFISNPEHLDAGENGRRTKKFHYAFVLLLLYCKKTW